ncbi:MAG: calcium-binding protein [Cyanobacteria bacterium P01_F01_bin.56]
MPKTHTYKVDYHNEAQGIFVVKDGVSTRVRFGDIVTIGNNRRITYIGNGNWRENDSPTSKTWPSKIDHLFEADEITSFQDFVRTGFDILESQLASSSDMERASNPNSTPTGSSSNTQTDTSLSATTASSVIEDNDGDNLLLGGQEADHLMGYGGADILFGNQGDDLLDGGRGSDLLVGGDGADTLIGGKGSDTFLFTSDQGIDIIKDFTDQDRIVIDASALGGVIVNPVYNSSTGELSVTRQTFEMQITYGQVGSISVPIATPVLVAEDITLAVLENPSGFDVNTDVSIV